MPAVGRLWPSDDDDEDVDDDSDNDDADNDGNKCRKKRPSRFLSDEEHDWHGENERALVATREDLTLSLESSSS